MPKADKEPKAARKLKQLFPMHPWSCHHTPGISSKIEAYVEAAGDWQTVATVQQTAVIDAEKVADFIADVVNDRSDKQSLIDDLVAALELCLPCKLTWEAEHDAEIVLARARQHGTGS